MKKIYGYFEQYMIINELLGLKWDNVDFDKKMITLKKQVVYISRRQVKYLSSLMIFWQKN